MPNKLLRILLSATLLPIFIFVNALEGHNDDNEDQDPNLPVSHLPFYYHQPIESELEPRDEGVTDTNNLRHTNGNHNHCWGYEPGCDFRKPFSFSYPDPSTVNEPLSPDRRLPYFGDIPKSEEEGRALFYSQADFGYIRGFRDSIRPVCTPTHDTAPNSILSSLECTELLGFCRARNIVIDFRHLFNRTTPILYDMDVLRDGHIGGNCHMNTRFIRENSRFDGALTSWGPEIQHFQQKSTDWRFNEDNCDLIVDRPTFIMKLDATSNMYHHFCDFLNLYATLFVNSSSDSGVTPSKKLFETDVNFLIWRSWYRSSFEDTFNAFTKHPLLNLRDYFGKRVCFRDAVFSLLPRMVTGLYYSTPLVPGYRGTGLFRGFSEFILHRLKIPQKQIKPDSRKLRVTFLSRKTTFRRILNEDEIIRAIKKNNTNLVVEKVEFSEKTDFKTQLTVIRNTDIFIGIHGAGLTHLLFLPKHAVVFEIYHCEDPNCYSELARMAGVNYMTWEDSKKVEAKQISANLDAPEHYHKHANYIFDVEETVRLVNKAVKLVIKDAGVSSTVSGHDEL